MPKGCPNLNPHRYTWSQTGSGELSSLSRSNSVHPFKVVEKVRDSLGPKVLWRRYRFHAELLNTNLPQSFTSASRAKRLHQPSIDYLEVQSKRLVLLALWEDMNLEEIIAA